MAIVRNLFALSVLLASGLAYSQLAHLKLEAESSESRTFRLYIKNKKTDWTLEAGSDRTFEPTLEYGQTRSGVIFGSLELIASGAITTSKNMAFAHYRGAFVSKEGYRIEQVRGEKLLFVHFQGGPWLNESSAFIYEKGKLTDIGYAHAAGFGKGGIVTGWYYAHEDGSPSDGQGADFDKGTYKQFFEFRNGVRRLTGRRLIY